MSKQSQKRDRPGTAEVSRTKKAKINSTLKYLDSGLESTEDLVASFVDLENPMTCEPVIDVAHSIKSFLMQTARPVIWALTICKQLRMQESKSKSALEHISLLTLKSMLRKQQAVGCLFSSMDVNFWMSK